jgi:hypothetical protein
MPLKPLPAGQGAFRTIDEMLHFVESETRRGHLASRFPMLTAILNALFARAKPCTAATVIRQNQAAQESGKLGGQGRTENDPF